MKQEIKKVRQTVDYIADNTDVRVVVKTVERPPVVRLTTLRYRF